MNIPYDFSNNYKKWVTDIIRLKKLANFGIVITDFIDPNFTYKTNS
jgi:hypothetical protein